MGIPRGIFFDSKANAFHKACSGLLPQTKRQRCFAVNRRDEEAIRVGHRPHMTLSMSLDVIAKESLSIHPRRLCDEICSASQKVDQSAELSYFELLICKQSEFTFGTAAVNGRYLDTRASSRAHSSSEAFSAERAGFTFQCRRGGRTNGVSSLVWQRSGRPRSVRSGVGKVVGVRRHSLRESCR